MEEDKKKKQTSLLLRRLSEKINSSEELKKQFEVFSSYPVEKVTDVILKELTYIFSGELQDIILKIIQSEINEPCLQSESAPVDSQISAFKSADITDVSVIRPIEKIESITSEKSVTEYYGIKDRFILEPIQQTLPEDAWYYLYGFSYAPDSSGKGIPSKQLSLKGIGGVNNIVILDYGDVRFFLSHLGEECYTLLKNNKPVALTKDLIDFQYEHERILNILRTQVMMVTLPFWTLVCGRSRMINFIEEKYVELLRALIDVHDELEWDVQVYVLDSHLRKISSVTGVSIQRASEREEKHPIPKRWDDGMTEKILFHEKQLAQEIHRKLSEYSKKGKILKMVSLDGALDDNWKLILSTHYTIGKEKRKQFIITVVNLQKEMEKYKLMFSVKCSSVQFNFLLS